MNWLTARMEPEFAATYHITDEAVSTGAAHSRHNYKQFSPLLSALCTRAQILGIPVRRPVYLIRYLFTELNTDFKSLRLYSMRLIYVYIRPSVCQRLEFLLQPVLQCTGPQTVCSKDGSAHRPRVYWMHRQLCIDHLISGAVEVPESTGQQRKQTAVQRLHDAALAVKPCVWMRVRLQI